MVSAVSVNSLKNRLDKLQATEEERFDYKVELFGCVLRLSYQRYIAGTTEVGLILSHY